MRRHVPGLHSNDHNHEGPLDGLFLVRVAGASYRWHPHKPFFQLRFVIQEPAPFATRPLSGRLYCSERAVWKLRWFLRDFGYDAELLSCDQVDEKALLNLRGVVRTSPISFNGRSHQNLASFAPEGEWEELSCATVHEAPRQVNANDL
jgi:hypothetical protein